jgi:hypothetical protein
VKNSRQARSLAFHRYWLERSIVMLEVARSNPTVARFLIAMNAGRRFAI